MSIKLRMVQPVLVLVISIAFFAGLPDLPANSSAAQHPAATLADFAWLVGSWEGAMGKSRVEEYWSRSDGDIMVGMGRTLANGKVREFEFLRIEARPDGIYYVAHPNARPGVDFKLAQWDGREAVFVNPGHADHLKKIIYRKNPDGSVTARIEGEDNGKLFAVDFPYQRMKSL
jgi:hypothetical protein